jgi:hypothetical protein
MTAGLPGVGIGGLFYLISALLMPLVEVVRTLQGRSSRERWHVVGRQFAMAVFMVGALTAVVVLLHLLLRPDAPEPAPGVVEPDRGGNSPVLFLASWLMLTGVLSGAHVVRRVLVRRRELTPA